jgi:hypothetical protein
MNFEKLKKECRNKTLLGIGPVSREVTKAAIEVANEADVPIMLIPSRRQVECKTVGESYVFETFEFVDFVKLRDKKNKIILARDHGGPFQGTKVTDNLEQEMEDAKSSYFFDIKAGFDILHLDPSINGKGFADVYAKILDLYNACEWIAEENKREIIYEVGTEVHQFGTGNLDDFKLLLNNLAINLPKVRFIVGDTGPYVKETLNVSAFNYGAAKQMIDLCDGYGVFLKEHNLDYTDYKTLSMHPHMGIHSANVAPEFGTEETRIFLNSLLQARMFHEYEEFIELCFKSGKWKKWMISDNSALYDYRQLAIICGHYLMETERVREIKKKLCYDTDYPEKVQEHLKSVICKYLTAFGWIK